MENLGPSPLSLSFLQHSLADQAEAENARTEPGSGPLHLMVAVVVAFLYLRLELEDPKKTVGVQDCRVDPSWSVVCSPLAQREINKTGLPSTGSRYSSLDGSKFAPRQQPSKKLSGRRRSD